MGLLQPIMAFIHPERNRIEYAIGDNLNKVFSELLISSFPGGERLCGLL